MGWWIWPSFTDCADSLPLSHSCWEEVLSPLQGRRLLQVWHWPVCSGSAQGSHQLLLIIQYTVVGIRIWLLFCFLCWFDVALVCCSDLISFSYQGHNSIRPLLYTVWDSDLLWTMQSKTCSSYIFGQNCDRHSFRLWKNVFKKKPLLKYFIYNWTLIFFRLFLCSWNCTSLTIPNMVISGVPPTCCFNLLFCANQKKLALKEGRRFKKSYDGLFLTEDELRDCRKS